MYASGRMSSGSTTDLLYGTVVPFAWYRGCTSIAAGHFSEMAKERCNAVRIDVSEEDLIWRMQEVAAVVQIAAAARLKPLVGLCGLAGLLGRGSLPHDDASRSPFLQNHQHARKIDGRGLPCNGQVCARSPEFIDYVCALCCAVGCIRNVGGISAVHANFTMCFCRMCQGDRAEDEREGAFRYQRKMPVLPDEDDEHSGAMRSAGATLQLLQAMFLSFRTAPVLAKSASAASLLGACLAKSGQVDTLARALRVLELSPQPNVMQPAIDVMLDAVPAATHVVLSLPCSRIPHKNLTALSSSASELPQGRHAHSPAASFEQEDPPSAAAHEGGQHGNDGCCWDAIAVLVDTSLK